MQVRAQVRKSNKSGALDSHATGKNTGKRHKYCGKARPAMEYYMHWSQGKVQSHMKRYIQKPDPESMHLSLGQQRLITTESVVEFLHVHRQRKCPQTVSAFRMEKYVLLDSSVDEHGAEHFVLRSSSGKFQYIAKHLQHILSAYPELCPSGTLTQIRTKVIKHQIGGPSNLTSGGKGGSPKNLDAATDPLVKDCKELFHRTAREKCGSDFELKVLNAVEKIIDGIAIQMQVEVSSLGNDTVTQTHDVDCDFEVPGDDVGAVLVQGDDDPQNRTTSAKDKVKNKTEAADGCGPSIKDMTDEERAGLIAKLSMEINLCKCDTASTTSTADIQFFELQKRRPSGELSRYKGFEHVNDNIPDVTQAVLLQFGKDVKDEIDLRTEYPNCYADSYKEPVRDQGTCGSCWAFASATATMNNLCGSADQDIVNQAMASAGDRYEISVQQILSCNSMKRGCDGGWAYAAGDAFESSGITRERTSTYQCGGGNPLHHFDKTDATCDKWPWGGECAAGAKKDEGFNWGGPACVSGETAMMAVLSQGWALYASFDTYANFMSLGSEIYSGTVGDKKGGHAVTIVAYGKDDGVKYWVLQNSWGSSWGLNGYGKMLRGKNLVGIETNAYYMRAWVTEAKRVPPCLEWETGLFDGSGNGIPCSKAKVWKLCDSADWGAVVKPNCPKTCGSCPTGTSGPVSPSPAAEASSPTPAPPPPPPDTCDDSTTYTDPYFGEACSFWNGYVCSGMSFSDGLEAHCPYSCKFCANPGGPIACTNDATYKDPTWGMTCEQWYGYLCDGYDFSDALKEACPKGCQLCFEGGTR